MLSFMASSDLWCLLYEWKMEGRGRSVWLTALALHTPPHMARIDGPFWLTGIEERCDCVHQYLLLGGVLYVYAFVVAVSRFHVTLRFQVMFWAEKWMVLCLTWLMMNYWLLAFCCASLGWCTALRPYRVSSWPPGSTASKFSSYPWLTQSFLPWILLLWPSSLDVCCGAGQRGWTRQKWTWRELWNCQKASWHLDSRRWKSLDTVHTRARGANRAVKTLVTSGKDRKKNLQYCYICSLVWRTLKPYLSISKDFLLENDFQNESHLLKYNWRKSLKVAGIYCA